MSSFRIIDALESIADSLKNKEHERIAELEAKLKSAEKDKQYANGKLSEAIVKLNELREILTEQSTKERGAG